MYKIVHPVQTTIYGPTLSDAVKNYVKIQNDMNLTNLIIQNDNLYRQTYIKYMKKNGKKIMKLNTIPLNPLYPLSYYIKEPLELESPPIRPNVRIGYPLLIPPPAIILPPYISPYIAM